MARMLRDKAGFVYGWNEVMAKQKDIYTEFDTEGGTIPLSEAQVGEPADPGLNTTAVQDFVPGAPKPFEAPPPPQMPEGLTTHAQQPPENQPFPTHSVPSSDELPKPLPDAHPAKKGGKRSAGSGARQTPTGDQGGF